jgi:hypothetical protein
MKAILTFKDNDQGVDHNERKALHSETPQEDEKGALSEIPKEKKMRGQEKKVKEEKKEYEKTRPLESTALSSADEP